MLVVMVLAISEGTVMGMVVVLLRFVWGHAYSDEEEVVRYVARMLLVISVANFFDGIQCVLSGKNHHVVQFLQVFLRYYLRPKILVLGRREYLTYTGSNMHHVCVGVARGCGWQKIDRSS